MKKTISILLLFTILLSGCRWGRPEDTTPSTQETQPSSEQTQPTEPSTQETQPGAASECSRILAAIWDAYGTEERFAAYGGAVENSISDAPGDLDVSNAEELTTRYLVPEDQLTAVREAASLVHLMNNNIFTGVVFRLDGETDVQTFAKALRTNVDSTQWICGQPDRLLIVQPREGHVLMAFGSEDAMTVFQSRLRQVFPDSNVLYDEPIAV